MDPMRFSTYSCKAGVKSMLLPVMTNATSSADDAETDASVSTSGLLMERVVEEGTLLTAAAVAMGLGDVNMTE
jgi:hypothetical protein